MSYLVLLVALLQTPHTNAVETATQHYAEGVKAAEGKQWNVAAEHFRRAIALDPKERAGYFPHYWLGVAYDELRQPSNALAEWRESQRQGAIAGTPEGDAMRRRMARYEVRRALPIKRPPPIRPIPEPVEPTTTRETVVGSTTAAVETGTTTPLETDTTAAIPEHHHDLSTPEGRLFDEIDRRFKALNPGQMVFNASDTMRVAVPERVVVRIAAAGQSDGITQNLPPSGHTETSTVHVTPVMRVTLAGAGFTIQPTSPEEQLIGGGSYSEWSWQVTPNESGERDLIASTIVTLDQHVKSFPVVRHIHVRSNALHASSGFLAANWQWLLTTLVIPLVVFWYQQRKNQQAAPRS